MRKSVFRAAVAAAGLLSAVCIAASAQATSYNVTNWSLDGSVGAYNGYVTYGGTTEYAGIGRIQFSGTVDGNANDVWSQAVYCIDVKDWLANGVFQRVVNVSPTGPGHQEDQADFLARTGYTTTQLDYVGYLIGTFNAGVTNADQSAGLQMAIWEVLNETSGHWDVADASSNFYVSGPGLAGAINLANNTYLTGLETALANHNISTAGQVLTVIDPGNGNQPQAFMSAQGLHDNDIRVPGVPEPTTWGMIVMGFGLLGAALRRRKQEGLFA